MSKGTDVQLTIIEHLNELRKRIVIVILVNIITSVVSYSKIDIIMKYIIKLGENLKLIYVSPPELCLEYIKVSIFVGVIAALPITLYQIWRYLKPALKKKERTYVILSLFMAVIFFAIGAAFGYIFVIPMAIKFFTSISASSQYVSPLFSINNYINFVITLICCFGIVFELPLIVLFLTFLNLVTPKFLRKNRKYAILIIFIVAAVLTPPDVVEQFLMALPMLLLYEISILMSFIVYRKNKHN